MSAVLARGPVTAALLIALQATGKSVGDGVRPPSMAGWSGQPNAAGSVFRPYLVLSALSASASSGSFASPQSEWRIPYMVASFGASRVQCEWMADLARQQLSAMRGSVLDLGVGLWKVQQVFHESIGGISRIDLTNPAYWSQTDQCTAWLSEAS